MMVSESEEAAIYFLATNRVMDGEFIGSEGLRVN